MRLVKGKCSLLTLNLLPCFNVLCLWLMLAFSTQCPGAQYSAFDNQVQVTAGSSRYNISPHIAFLVDETNSLAFADVLSLQDEFRLNQAPSVNRGLQSSHHWFRITLDRSAAKEQQWILSVANSALPYIEIFRPDHHGRYASHVIGSHFSQSTKELKDRTFAFLIDENVSHHHPIYIQIRVKEFMIAPFFFYSASAWVAEKRLETAVYAGCFSVLVAMSMFSFFLFLTTRDRNYLYYIVYLVFVVGYGLAQEGFIHEFLLPENTFNLDQVLSFFAFGGLVFAAMFTDHFLEAKKRSPWMHRFLIIGMIWSAIAAAVHVLEIKNTVFSIGGILAGIFIPIVVFMSACRIYQLGFEPAKYFLVAWGMLIVTTIYLMFHYLGVIHYDRVIQFGMYVASAAESILLAFALAHRIKTLEEEKRSAKREMYNALQEKYRQLISVNKVKDEFLSNVSHELRTPINGIYGSLDLLETASMDPEQRRLVGLITGCSKQMQLTVDRVLDYAEINSGRLQVQESCFELSALVDDLKTQLIGSVLKKGLQLDVNLATGLPQAVISSPECLNKLLYQLLENAVKFTKEGRVQLNVSWQSPMVTEVGTPIILRFAVIDTGEGLPPQVQSSLFKAFEQLDGSLTREFEGMGLGLATVTGLVNALQGSLQYRLLNPGSEFAVDLPLKIAKLESLSNLKSQTSQVTTPSLQSELPKNTNVLVVEDNKTNALVLKGLLKKLNVNADVAENGEIAVAMAESKVYDLVFMDCQMPVMDGYEATRQLRKLTSYHQVPIVAVTANAHSTDRANCLQVGMSDYIKKPVNLAIVKKALQFWLFQEAPGGLSVDQNKTA